VYLESESISELEIRLGVNSLYLNHPPQIGKGVTRAFSTNYKPMAIGILSIGNVATFLFQLHKATTVWCVRHLPHNREVFLTSGGSGSLHLWK